ncbi:unnamed protein product, partial [Meganyctiphanes norvegica]
MWCYSQTSFDDSRRSLTILSLSSPLYLHSSGENAVYLIIVLVWLGTVLYLPYILLIWISPNQKCSDFVSDYNSLEMCHALELYTTTHYQIIPISGINVSSPGAKVSYLFIVLVCFISTLLFLHVVKSQYFLCPLCDFKSKPRCYYRTSYVDSR